MSFYLPWEAHYPEEKKKKKSLDSFACWFEASSELSHTTLQDTLPAVKW